MTDVDFGIHPLQQRLDVEHVCDAPVPHERTVTDSGGHRERRIFICTPVTLDEHTYPVALSPD